MKEVRPRPKIVIAGASGFVGRALLQALTPDYQVVGLSRNPPLDEYNWQRCDLFSLHEAEEALEGADFAIYLVHSMMPSARLTQGTFEDMDLILADNFARAAKKAGVKQIIYLGEIIPQGKELSVHLRSRLEVEQTLRAHGVPVTALRSALIIGAGGPGFRILLDTIKRLPVLSLSSWKKSLVQPIWLGDVITIFRYCLGNQATYGKTYDIGGPDVLTYGQMIQKTAETLGYTRKFIRTLFYSVSLSSILISAITGAPRALVYPLVASLKFDMVAQNFELQQQMGLKGMPFQEALRISLLEQKKQQYPRESAKEKVRRLQSHGILNVRSVQRLPLPKGKDADWAARYYSQWLPTFFPALIKVKVDEQGNCDFYFGPFSKPLLELTFASERSSKDHQLYYITGGLLARPFNRERGGRLEFRQVLNGQYLLAAIHDYVPALPWFLYNLTQAPLHLWVMKSYGRHLAKLAK